jgi:hypothetical protein
MAVKKITAKQKAARRMNIKVARDARSGSKTTKKEEKTLQKLAMGAALKKVGGKKSLIPKNVLVSIASGRSMKNISWFNK